MRRKIGQERKLECFARYRKTCEINIELREPKKSETDASMTTIVETLSVDIKGESALILSYKISDKPQGRGEWYHMFANYSR